MSYVDEVIELVVTEESCRAGISPGSKRSIGIIASGNRSKRGEVPKRRICLKDWLSLRDRSNSVFHG